MKILGYILGTILIFLLLVALSFGIIAGALYLLSLCFGFQFTWLLAIGVYIVALVLHLFIKGLKD